MEVCELVAHYDDALPEQVFNKLRSFMHDIPHGRLIAALEAQRTYAVGAFCLRKMMEGRSDRRDQVQKCRSCRRDDLHCLLRTAFPAATADAVAWIVFGGATDARRSAVAFATVEHFPWARIMKA